MSRPANLPTALQSWANANYAGGPAWGGTAQRSTPAGTALVPGVSFPAEVANYLLGNAFDAAQNAINLAGEIPPLNWQPFTSLGASSNAMGWSDAEQSWYVGVNGSATGQQSMDYGKYWTNVTYSGAFAAFFDIAFDPSGNGVVASGVNTVSDGPFVAYGTAITWASRTLSGAVTPTTMAQVAYEPVSALWCYLGGKTAVGSNVFTSPDRAVWTTRTIPATWSTNAVNNYVRLGAGNGILVAAFRDSSTTFRTMRSANGGITWTNDQAITVNAGITLPDANGTITRPFWSATDLLWYVACNQTATRKSQVFSSPDGITWTSAAYLGSNDAAFVEVVGLGSLLVATNYNDGRIYASWNKGVNWWKCGGINLGAAATVTVMKSGGNGIGAIIGARWGASIRIGVPVTAA